jgi:hypothetical protein
MRHLTRAVPLFAGLALGTLDMASDSLQGTNCGNPISGIALCLASIPATDRVSVEIRNDGSSDVIVRIGIMLANGARQYPNAITLLVQDSAGVELEGTSIDPPGVAGRVDPLALPLPAGAAARVPLRLSRYVFHAAHRPGEVDLGGERRAVRAKLTGHRPEGSELSSYWTGTAVSNTVMVVMPNAPGK